MTDFEEWLEALEQDLAQPKGTEERQDATDRLYLLFLEERADEWGAAIWI